MADRDTAAPANWLTLTSPVAYGAALAGTALAYVVGARVGFLLAFLQGQVSPVWRRRS